MTNVTDKFIYYIKNGMIENAKALYVSHPDINISAKYELAFKLACFYGYLEIVKWLLEIKPNINISIDDEFVFRYICRIGHLEVVKWLLVIKPDININVDDDYSSRHSKLIIRKLLSHYIPHYDVSSFKTIQDINKCSSLFDLI